MKKTTKFILLFIALTNFQFAQWQADVRLTNSAGYSVPSPNNAKCIAVNGSNIHIVWEDNRDGNYEIYYKKSGDGGVNWGTDIRLTNNLANSLYPSIAVSGNQVNIAWEDDRDGNAEIYYKRSTNNGIAWSSDIRVTNNDSSSNQPSISVSGAVIHLSWEEFRDGNNEIYYKRSTNGGMNWGSDSRLTNNTASSNVPAIECSGLQVHVVWTDLRDHNNGEIYYKRSIDAGLSWGTDMRLTNVSPSGGSWRKAPTIALSGSRVHLIWLDRREGVDQIYYKHSTDNGLNWIADSKLTFSGFGKWHPSIAVSDFQVHVVWDDYSAGNSEIYYRYSPDGGNIWNDSERLTNNVMPSNNPFIAFSGSVVHVMWSDYRDGNQEIYYKNNPTGNIGIYNISSEIPSSNSLSQNYPNPFNPTTRIRFEIPKTENLKITVFDALGSELETIVNQTVTPGIYETEWDGSKYPSGMYFYKIICGNYTETKKMILVK